MDHRVRLVVFYTVYSSLLGLLVLIAIRVIQANT